jgi:membrane-bound metal-dependent hydrolase YbcI (DUF457 family)
MFVGHYGPAFAVGASRHAPSMGAAFVAVQAVDYGWAALNYVGIEQARIVPGFAALSHLDLFHMPYTHSLPAALVWSLAGMLIYRLIDRRSWQPALLIGLCVFSHWLLDFLVHMPDLELWPGGPKVGLGLWDQPMIGGPLELAVLVGGFLLYVFATRGRTWIGKTLPWLLLALLCVAQAVNWHGPIPTDMHAMLPQALAAYTVIALLGFALDATRERKY